jgi:hypothetical protein
MANSNRIVRLAGRFDELRCSDRETMIGLPNE